MSDISKATSRPWRIEQDTALIWGNCTIGDDGGPDRLGIPVAECKYTKPNWGRGADIDPYANAALIIRAVNEYDADKALIAELVSALEYARDELCRYEEEATGELFNSVRINTALARAKVQP